MRHFRIALAACLSAFAVGCAVQRSSGVPEYYGGNRQAAKAIYEEGVKGDRSSRALYLLRLATLELDEGDIENSREHFVEATGIMQNFKAEGEFKALVGSESAKEYKGDPYEQMMAFWYLGLLGYMSGDYGKAFPSFRAAALADGGSTEERYQADAASVYIMMGKTRDATGDHLKAQEDYKEAGGVYSFRQTVDCVAAALEAGRADAAAKATNADAVNVAYDLLAEGIGAGATQEQDPAKALAATREFAFELLEKVSKSRSQKPRLGGQDPNIVSGCIKDIVRAAEGHVAAAGGRAAESPLFPIMRSVCDPANNFFVVAAIGKGPFKYRAGSYGELARIGQSDYPEKDAEIYVDGRFAGAAQTVEDIHYQASTRGGRAMDGVLGGKAVFKGATAFLGTAVLGAAATEDSPKKRRNTALAGLSLLALSAATRPEADIRSWETLPDKIQMLAAKVPAGKHTVEVRFTGGAGQRFENVLFSDKDETILYVRSGGGGAWACPLRRPL